MMFSIWCDCFYFFRREEWGGWNKEGVMGARSGREDFFLGNPLWVIWTIFFPISY